MLNFKLQELTYMKYVLSFQSLATLVSHKNN